jgi:hypothetical protein
MVRGKTGAFFISVYQNDGVTPQSLVGGILYFHADVGGIELDYDSDGNGITITNTAGGADCATLLIPPADTLDIPDTGTFEGPCELVLGIGGQEYPLNTGTFIVQPNVGMP